MFRSFARQSVCLTCCLLVAAGAAFAQKALTNADVLDMVKSGLPESTIIKAMQANPSNFDVTPAALIALHDAGVSQKVLDAMITVASKKANAGRSTLPGLGSTMPNAPRATSVLTSRYQPSVTLVHGETRQVVAMDRTRLAQAKTKPSSLADLSKDEALDTALRTGFSQVRGYTGRVGGVAVGEAGRIAAKALKEATTDKTVTYVWVVQKDTSATVVPSDSPGFEIAMNSTRGVKAEDYEPAIVKLTPSRSARLVGATQGKAAATTKTTLDWPLYSAFIEDRVPVQASAGPAGTWKLSVSEPLPPGEYAVVLRPISKNKQFAGVDVARNQGDGLMFNSVWSFSIQ